MHGQTLRRRIDGAGSASSSRRLVELPDRSFVFTSKNLEHIVVWRREADVGVLGIDDLRQMSETELLPNFARPS
jgi:hypothetical protein